VEVALYPGKGTFEPLNHVVPSVLSELNAGCLWLGMHQERLVSGPTGFLLPDFASQVCIFSLLPGYFRYPTVYDSVLMCMQRV
jgi:hypothetical protein